MPDLAKIENSKTDVKTQEFFAFIDKVKKHNPNEPITIAFWGGEPFMNFQYCLDVMNFFKNDLSINFFFYTNGTYIGKYKEELREINNVLKGRLEIQISYDGGKVNDVERLTKTNKPTSKVVKEAFALLGELGINRAIKSTITPRTFKYIYDAFVDVVNIPGNTNYFPTPESFMDYDSPMTEQYYKDLQVGLMKIAKYIYENDLPPESFGWFRNNKALCQAGIGYYGINIDGKMSPCHSTMYSEWDDHEVADLRDDDVIEKLNANDERFKKLLGHMNDDCQGCTALYCMKCPAGSYSLPSTQETAKIKMTDVTNELDEYETKWTTKNHNMCRVFKTNDIIHKALLTATKKEPALADGKRCTL